MVQSIKSILTEYGIDGDIILYRDADHKKKGLCEYIAKSVPSSTEVVTYSDGAFGLYLSRALPKNIVHTCYINISPDYGELMEAQSNLILHPNLRRATNYEDFLKEHPKYFQINQCTEDIIWEYYKSHFAEIVDAVKEYKIDAFCDYSHSGATLRGFVEANKESNLVDWQFIMAVTDVGIQIDLLPRFKNHTSAIKSEVTCEFCCWLNTFDLGEEIEQAFPEFGNVYEATRSIAGAMNWLKKNPNKTVLIYVGDNFIKEGTKFRKGSRSIVGTTESVILNDFINGVKEDKIIDRSKFTEYYNLFIDTIPVKYKKYILSSFMKRLLECFYMCNKSISEVNFVKFMSILQSINTDIKDTTIKLVYAVLFGDNDLIKSSLQLDIENDGDILIQRLVASYLENSRDYESMYNNTLEQYMEIHKTFRKAGAINL